MSFHDTVMGHRFFEHQLPQLIQSIQSLTTALAKPPQTAILPVEADPEFLSELYFGNFECGVFKQTAEPNELEQAVKRAYNALAETLPERNREELEAYLDAAAERNSDNMRRAYESGFRTAVQMIMAGMSRQSAGQ